MKKLLMAASLMTTLNFSAFATIDMVCYDKISSSKIKTKVKIKHLADMTKNPAFGNRYDSVERVQVDFTQTSEEKLLFAKSFEAVATSGDVEYNISAVKSQGFKFWAFLDEADAAGVELTYATGDKRTINLTCTW